VVVIFHYKAANADNVHVSRHQLAQIEAVEAEVCGQDQAAVTHAVDSLLKLEPRQETLLLTEKVCARIACSAVP
jgi:hypothetical protein